ncbi:thioesterase family protein [Microdochium trichocladiopsis]|uniref:Thioesterase family protein n=1 Tax=Microdochium trichocladiopsis TaxID=1682393 RepID=A0A9P9BJX8_9PEZI|nr:thioesterase family protein [Microdochium trichocladiopsis]KAH7026049.1 thioesterase family protein [Microdochium trichocladiopsis]
MATKKELQARTRDDYPYMLDYRTRWADNDMYDHMNNSVYNYLFDSVINAFLIEHCGLHPPSSPWHPLMAHTAVHYFSAIEYPKVAELGLRISKLGNSAVTYEVGLFEKGGGKDSKVKAVGEFVHVWVERRTQRPSPQGMDPGLRAGLEGLRDGKISNKKSLAAKL